MPKEVKLSKVIIDILAKTASFLKEYKISYAVMGGIALQAWGKERVTRDIDITISLGSIKHEDFLQLLKKQGVKPVFPKKEKQIGSFRLIETHYTSPELNIPIEIDFFIAQTEYQKQVLNRAVLVDVMGCKLKLISPEDLIIHKLLSARPIDRADVKDIVVEQKRRLDKRYLFFWAKRLGIPRRTEQLWEGADYICL